MSDSLRDNPIALRACILYDVLQKKTIDDSYSALCDVIGNDAISRENFNFWFNRFEEGKFELEIEPKARYFSELSTDVVGVFVENLDLEQQLTMRKVSRSLREIVDDQQPSCNSLRIIYRIGNMCIEYNGQKVHYADKKFEPEMINYDVIMDDDKVIFDDDYEKVALADLSILLKNPKLKLNVFEFTQRLHGNPQERARKLASLEPNFQKFEQLLTKTFRQDRKFWVKNVEIQAENPTIVMRILPFLKPRHLEKIKITGDVDATLWRNRAGKLIVDQIVKTVQWNLAVDVALWLSWDFIPLKHFGRFKRFEIATFNGIGAEDFVRMRDFFSNSPNFEFCEIRPSFGYEKGPLLPLIGSSGHYPIRGSDYNLEIKLDRNILIEKKLR